ncbi:hypothetical protein M758_1G264400 [Ceratodon purpureus]|nr:hypothetical protein KC19_1G272200 [Ceratodon purpureus]KAG0631587.1 hypothetical protein M758_1G264400 [Ceratodon purpureus]KAG0631589.1 hypothetical protein M758_1G264400 [Ceratodon purpureus]
MGIVGPKTLLLGLVVAVLAVAAAQASVTVYNPAGLLVDILVDDKNVKVTSEMMTLNVTQGQQNIKFQVSEGEAMEVSVQDGDVLVLIPDPSNPLHAVLALKVQEGGVEFGSELLAPPLASPLPEVESTPALP